MILTLAGVVIALGLFLASITDIKTREVPDFLSYSLIILGLLNGAASSIVAWHYWPFVSSLSGFLIMLLLSLALFYTGQWGGGDSKLLMGIGAWLGLGFIQNWPALAVFLINAMLAGGIYGLAWSLILLLRNRKKVMKEFVSSYSKHRMPALALACAVLVLMIFVVVLVANPAPKVLMISALLLVYLLFFLWFFVKAIEKVSFYKRVRPSKLTEGDWIVEPVKHEGKLLKVNPFGVTKQQIATLIKLEKSRKLKSVLIKEGIPFVPALFFGFLMTIILGNWFLWLV